MSAAAIAAIVVVVVIVAVVMLAMMVHRRRVQQRFGDEYGRLVAEHHSQFRAQAELGRREWRVQRLAVRPLTDAERARFATDWTAAQARFVDSPLKAVTDGGDLVAAIMKERGYPADSPDRIVGDLSVAHPGTVTDYRIGRQIGMDAAMGTVSTEDLRQAMIHYRAVFGELLGNPGESPADGPHGTTATTGEPHAIGTGSGHSGPEAPEPEMPEPEMPEPRVLEPSAVDSPPRAAAEDGPKPTGRFRVRVPQARGTDEERL